MMRWAVIIVGALGAGAEMTVAQGDPEAGKKKAVICAGCHGKKGMSPKPLWPHLAGQHAAYLALQLRAFRDGTRKNVIMEPIATALSDTDIADLAAYYAAQMCQ